MRNDDVAIRYRISEVFDMDIKQDDAGVKSIVLDTRAVRFELILDDPVKTQDLARLLGIHIQPKPKKQVNGKMPRLYAHDVKESKGVEESLNAIRK